VPFADEFEYAFASWLSCIHCTKGDVEELFADPRLSPLHDMLGFKSANEWEASIDAVPHGIRGNPWSTTSISVPGVGLDGQTPTVEKHELLHQNVVDIISFQLSYQPFREHLRYVPERIYRQSRRVPGRDVRMYTSLGDSDWWWDVQRSLPDGATVVPVLIGVDKTHLTNHRGDQVAWPVYISIGNLDARIRRSRKCPGNILAGLLPVTKHSDALLRARLYHLSMGRLLERTYALGVGLEDGGTY
jgi:hypothetical protein